MLFNFTRSELKGKKASDFVDGDVIRTGHYYIYIKYTSRDGLHTYSRPSLCSYHEREDLKRCGCTPGVDRPYYIDDFLNK